jgi:DNA-binding LacI/PurR family transcriptional regulator
MTKKPVAPKRPVTMRDVAKRAGVSQPTVSRVLNQTHTAISISDETRSKVMAAIEELNYQPNVLARSLRTQKTQMIAVMVAHISNSFYHPIVAAIQDVASAYEYDVMIGNTDHLQRNEVQFCEAVTRRPVDGVILVPIHLTTTDIVSFINRTQTPVVVLGNQINHPMIDVVHVDDETPLTDATRWLIHERGHRRFGFITVEDDVPIGPRRFAGVKRALDEAGLSIRPEHIAVGDFTIDSGRRAALQLIEADELPSVVVALNDLMAIGAILTFQEAGLRVPEDIAVMGFDDIPEASIVRPALTTIAQDSTEIGRNLAECLFNRIANPTQPRVWHSGEAKLIIRDSA